MPDLKRALEGCGLSSVRTRLSSGNATFLAPHTEPRELEPLIEAALQQTVGRTFAAFVRSQEQLERILSLAQFTHPSECKPIIAFVRTTLEREGFEAVHRPAWSLLMADETQVYGFYTPGRESSSLMAYLKKQFGIEFTTRTVETVRTCSET
jgi:uncharacterized protein (DUF1697 family)